MINKRFAVNYFRAVLQQEVVNFSQQNIDDSGALKAVNELERRLRDKLSSESFFETGLNKIRRGENHG